jgi:hypothetical protein
MSSPIKSLGQIGGVGADIGLSIMQLGMVTGLHAAISPSFFTFACFAKKPEEREIAKKTLWVSLVATTFANLGILLAFNRWTPAIAGQIAGTGLFVGGMMACSTEGSPAEPTMNPQKISGMGRIRMAGFNPTHQPNMLKAQSHWLDRRYKDTYSNWWEVPDTVADWI